MTAFMSYSAIKAADKYPSVNPKAIFIASNKPDSVAMQISGSAPIKGYFYACPQDADGWEGHYEWNFYREGDTTPYLTRYDEDTELTFYESGLHQITLNGKFVRGDEEIEFSIDKGTISCVVSESKLEMPNAFSPNGDEFNEIYKAKDSYQSIVEFHAYIFNRYGQKLFEWTDPADGWDGTYKGKPVKEGVYYVLVKAKGSDGIDYLIKRDVNLMRNYIQGTDLNNNE